MLRRAAGDGRLTMDELDERLNTAYESRTRAELELLVADVLAPGDQRAVGAPQHRLPVRRGEGGARWLVAIMGGCDRRGRWRLAERVTSLNIMGGADLDLNDAELADDHVQLTVFSLMGGADILVPDGLNVEVSDFALMGSNGVDIGDSRPDPGGPTLRLRLISIMGGTRRQARSAQDAGGAARRAASPSAALIRSAASRQEPSPRTQRRPREEEEPRLEREPGEHDRADEDLVERPQPRPLRLPGAAVERLQPRRLAAAGGAADQRVVRRAHAVQRPRPAPHSSAITTITTSTAVIDSPPASPLHPRADPDREQRRAREQVHRRQRHAGEQQEPRRARHQSALAYSVNVRTTRIPTCS